MKTFLQAGATMEGFYKAGSRPQRNNSPGDLVYGSEAIRFGATGADGRYAIFPDASTGWKAYQRWLSVPAKFTEIDPGDERPSSPKGYLLAGYLGATIEQALWRFAPPSDGNNATNYRDYVCGETGLAPTDFLTSDVLLTPEVE